MPLVVLTHVAAQSSMPVQCATLQHMRLSKPCAADDATTILAMHSARCLAVLRVLECHRLVLRLYESQNQYAELLLARVGLPQKIHS